MDHPDSNPYVIFTDLDGTLLDQKSYEYRQALAGLNLIQYKDIPLVFCSSKTRSEQMIYRAKLGINHPFIVEDGGAIFIEADYFPFEFEYDKSIGIFKVFELGTSYPVIREALLSVQNETGIQLNGYGDLSIEEVSNITGLDKQEASLAMAREYQETLVTVLEPNEALKVEAALKKHGLRLNKGRRFCNISGQNDKGKAVTILASLYRQLLGEISLIGIGDSYNDVPLFNAVDIPVLVQKSPNTWETIERPDNIIKVLGVGPLGWNRFVIDFLSH
ncbi:MAG: mannosyl-3-phosphoglycerate phosphatase [Candidatus Latescibacteria bacterium]|nr:mannosyl-3-phosphoglycerate phosphatase [Candidatus Latescibacterota bacterium]NIM64421.1 mannosyl-3-phosphoglycerate phosphatase [Candidatus Latescibacterota bacterium]NIO00575.1 mannosyl-3-phosphoglycerate phosphatase [Candidatus Latescibacterota bacterium]NIO26975.1 mannosyl-3-phosphoglycerate phosphatase [Candidatus Latescibacterota bacterium]NIO56052.1 mannosyl-3-phosphoglycerate phosphatase [Candidatus Latescibacterota bacterium]